MTLKQVLFVPALLLLSDFTSIGSSPEFVDRRVYESLASQEETKEPEPEPQPEIVGEQISPFDSIMQRVAAEEGLDWRLIAAIAYHESRFDPDARSHAGATGLMQVMGSVARSFGASPEEIKDPATNIEVAVKLLKRIEQSLRFGSGTSQEDRMKIVLACYNAGIGHIGDARRLAVKHGANHNCWSTLSQYVVLKGTPEWVDDEVVKNGPFKGGQTIAFVSQVMSKYAQYCKKYS